MDTQFVPQGTKYTQNTIHIRGEQRNIFTLHITHINDFEHI